MYKLKSLTKLTLAKNPCISMLPASAVDSGNEFINVESFRQYLYEAEKCRLLVVAFSLRG